MGIGKRDKRLLALAATLAVLAFGAVFICASADDSYAEATSGDVMDGTTDVGDWRITGTTLDIVSVSTSESFTALDGYESTSSTSIELVTIKGFLGNVSEVLTDSPIGISSTVPIHYYGDIPSFTKKSDGTNYCSNRGIGIWTYDLSSKELTLERSTSTSYTGLISYESSSINTIFYGYFFLDTAESVLITGYENYGGDIFHEFTALETFHSTDHLTLGNVNLLKGVGFKSVTFDRLTTFDTACLTGDTNLLEIHLLDINMIKYDAFKGCTNLSTIQIVSPNNLTIESNAFNGCTSITNLNINASVSVTLGAGAFRDCSSMVTVAFNTSAFTVTGENAFLGDSQLQEAYLGNGPVSLANYAFMGCTNLTKVNIDKLTKATAGAFKNTSIGGYVYDYGTGTFVLLPESDYLTLYSVTELGGTFDKTLVNNVNGAFEGCLNIKKVQFGTDNGAGGTGALTKLGNKTFSGCTNLVEVDFNTPVLSGCLGANMFASCGNLTTITGLGSSKMDSLGNGAFLGCNKLTTLELSNYVESIANDTFSTLALLEYVDAGTGLKTIGNKAFYNCPNLTTFIHGDYLETIGTQAFALTPITSFVGGTNLQTIGNSAFNGCKELTSFTVGASLKTIGSNAFEGCIKLTTFDASSSVLETVGEKAFYMCTILQTVRLGNSLVTINNYAFLGDAALTSVIAGDSLVTIGYQSFMNCSLLQTFECGNNLELIRTQAFSGCTALTTFTGSFSNDPHTTSNVNYIQNSAFNGCIALANIDLGDHTRYIQNSAFYGCKALTEFNLGSEVTTIEYNAFRDCVNLKNAGNRSDWVMPDTLTTIGSNAFRNTILETLTFGPDSTIDTIGSEAFREITSLKGTDTVEGLAVKVIKFPDTLKKVDTSAFYGCTSLQGIYLSSNNALYYVGSSAFSNCDLHGSLTFTNVLTTLGSSAFQNNRNLAEVIFSSNSVITTINSSCFAGCTSLANVVLPNSVTLIDSSAFSGSLCTNFTFGSGLVRIGNNAFNSSSIVSVSLPDSCTSIGTGAFYDCNRLTYVDLNNAILEKDNSDLSQTFRSCDSLVTVNLGNRIEDIPRQAFYGCPALTTVIWSPTLINVNNQAFAYCYALTSVELPSTIETIGTESFYSCTSLTTVDLNNVLTIGNSSFRGCSMLTTVDLGSNLTTVPDSAFRSCPRLANITFSPVLTTIGPYAFAYPYIDAYGLKNLVIPDSVTTIGNNAFFNANNLESLTLGKGITSLGESCFGYDYTSYSSKFVSLTVPIGLNLVQYTSQPVFRNVTSLQTIHYISGGAGSTITDGFDYVYGTSGVDDFARHPASQSKSKLTTVIIDDDITSLGNYNLYGLTAMTTLSIPIHLKPVDSADSHNFENVKTIREVTFTGTDGIDYSLTEGGSDHWIGQTPWYYSTVNTLSVTFAPSVQSIGKNMFNNESGAFSKLKNVTMDGTNTIEVVGEKAFYNCSNFIGDVVLNDVETLGDMCFYGTSIGTFVFGEELINIGDRALYDMEMTSVTVAAGNPQFTSSNVNVLYGQSSGTITSLVLYPAKKAGTSYIVPDTVQTIRAYAAYGAQFTTLSIPSGVYYVGEYAFASGKLVTLTVLCEQPDFDTGAFANNSMLATVSIPLSMSTAGVFAGSNNITSYTFTGSGTSGLPADYYINNAGDLPWSSTNKSVTVAFSEGISAVDNNMFDFPSASTCITSVTLPSSLVSIGNAAFRNCNGLTAFTIPDNVSTMGTDCLAGCTKILTLTVPISLNMAIDPNHLIGITSPNLKLYFTAGNGTGYTYSTVESAGDYWGNTPWAQITGLTVTLNEGIVNTGSNLFLKAGNLFLPNSLDIIGDNAFNGATMAAVDLKSITHLGYCAFANCSKITSVTVPTTLETYGGSSFKDCTKITAVTLPINIDYSEGLNGSDGMFTGCIIVANYTFVAGASSDGHAYTAASSAKTPWYLNLENARSPSLTFSSGITSVGAYMFYNCNRPVTDTLTYGIASATFPATVAAIGDSAFEGCAYMSPLTFTGQNVASIGSNAYKGCAGLTSLAVGPSTTFGAGAFSGCDKLATLTLPMRSDAVVNNTNPVFTTTLLSTLNFIGSGDGFDYSETSESGSYYKLTPWYKSTKVITLNIGGDITSIGDNTFRECQGIRMALNLPDNIGELGNSVFRGCMAITTVSANKVSRIGTNVFQDSSVTTVTMPSLIVVQDYAFYNCRSLSTATLAASTHIGAHAFQDSTISKYNSNSGIDLTGIVALGEGAFSGCTNIDGDITVSAALVTIGASAFFGDANITGIAGAVTGITSVGVSAFEGCTSLTGDLTLNAAGTVGDRAFYGTAVTSFTFSNLLTSLGDLALFDQSLTSIATGTNTKYVVDNTTGALYQVSGSTRILLQYPAAKVLDADFTIASNVSEIAHFALYGAKIHGTLTIPSSMTLTIGDDAFSNAEFTGLNIPNTLPLAGLFIGCTNISSYYFSMKNNVSGFPADYFTVNESTLPWHYSNVDYSAEFQSGIIGLDANMFKNSSRLISLTIPTTVGTLGEGFIYGCTGLQTLVAPANLSMDITAGDITTLKTLRLTVSGTAHSTSYSETTGKLTPWYSSTLTSLTIDSGILSIGDYFYLRTSANIVLPSTVTSVGDYSFYGSTTSSITFSSNLQTIGDYAFYGCTLTSVALPAKVTTIGDRAFADNNSLTSVTLPDSITGYAGQPFYGCVNISNITVPITLDYSSGIFEGCELIRTYTFTPGTNGVGFDYTVTGGATPWYTAVSRSYSVSVTLNEGIKSIGAYMFYQCAKGNYGIEGAGTGAQEKFVIIPDTVTTIGAHVFDSCKNIPGFVFGTGIADVGDYAFYDCDGASFTDVTLGESIRTVGAYAFAYCANIASVSLGSGLTALGAGSFNNCTSITSLSLPLSVNAVANDVHPAFEGCSNLSDITFVGTGAGFAYSDVRSDDESVVGSYYQLTPWYLNQSHAITLVFDNQSTISSIGSNTFRGSTAISGTLTLPTSVSTIGSYAFQGCQNISGITLSGTLATIGDYAFEGCTSLSGNLVSTVNLKTIGAHVFEGDVGITGLTGVVTGIETIGAYAFNGCVDLGGDLALTAATSIGERAFYGTVVSSFSFGRNLASLGDLALFDQNLASITVDSNNTTYNVRDGILYRGTTTVVQYPAKMTRTTGYEIPNTVTDILHYAFYGADISGTLSIPNKAVPIVIGEQAFSHSGITALVIPVNIPSAYLFENCTDIASYTFTGIFSGLPEDYYSENMGHLAWNFTDPSVAATVTFADGVTSVDNDMFYGFGQLSVLNIPTSVTALGTDCLKGCNGLTSLTVPIILDMAVDAGSGITQLSTVNFIGTGPGKEYGSADVGSKVLWYYSTISSLSINSGITSIGAYSYLKVSGEIVMPDSVVSVGAFAFYGSTTGDITFSNSLQTIGANAFPGCGLTSLVLPSTVTALGDNAFGGCTLLQSVTLPDGLVSYEGKPFNGCAALATVSLPISIDYSLGMFNGCAALRNYTFTAGNGTAVDYTDKSTSVPWYTVVRSSNNINVSFADGVRTIGAHMFDGCNYSPTAIMTYGIIGDGEHGEIVLKDIRTVGDYAFSGCTKITGVQFGADIETIGVHAFANCAGITELVLAGNTTVGAGAFSNCTGIASLTIPLSADSVVSNADPVFRGCTGLTSVTFIGSGPGAVYSDSPSSGSYYKYTPWFVSQSPLLSIEFSNCTATSIGANMFRDVSRLGGTVVVPSTVETIGEYAFYGTSVETFNLGPALNSIGNLAFFDQNLASIVLDGNNTDFALYNGALYTADLTVLIVVPAKMAVSDIVLPSVLITVLPYAAYGSVMIGTLTIPASVQSIGNYAFAECTGLTGLVVETIVPGLLGTGCFLNDTGITSITIPYTVRMAGLMSFPNNVSSYTFTGGANSGQDAAYYRLNASEMPWNYATGDVSIVFSPGIGKVDDFMFYHESVDTHIVSVTFPEGLTTIGIQALQNCAGLQTLVIPNSLSTLGTNALAGCGNVRDLTIPITFPMDIDNGNIGMSHLQRLTFTPGSGLVPAGYESTYTKTLWYPSNGNGYTVVFQSGIAAIGEFMYLQVSAATFPDTLQTIGSYAFYRSSFTAVSLNEGLQTIGDKAFAETSLASIRIPTTVTELEGSPFDSCAEITTMTGPITIDYSGGCFSNCGNLSVFNFTVGTANQGEGFDYTSDSSANTPWMDTVRRDSTPTVSFDQNIVSIGDYMFSKCSSNGYGISGALKLPANLVSVGDYAFEECNLITSITFGSKVRTIGAYAFAGCSNSSLKTLVFGTSLTTLGEGSFKDCSKIISLTIPIGVNAVANDGTPAFDGCASLTNFTFIGTGDGFDYSSEFGNDAYYQLTPWYQNRVSTILVSVGGSINSIGDYMFAGCTGIRATIDLKNVTEIGESAFAEADRLLSVTGPKVETIKAGAFTGCDALGNVTFFSVTAIGNDAFRGCAALRSATITQCSNIGERAFKDSGIATINGAVGTISLPKLGTLGAYAFEGSGAESVILGTTGEGIVLGDHVLDNCSHLTSLIINGDLEVLPAATFQSGSFKSPVKEVFTPAVSVFLADLSGSSIETLSVTGPTSFISGDVSASLRNCTSLTTVSLDTDDGVRITLPEAMFDGCTALSTIPLTNVILSGPNTFRNCSLLPFADLTIATTLPAGTFYGCSNLTEVTAPLVTAIGDSAFESAGRLAAFNSDTSGKASFAGITAIGDRAFYGTALQTLSDMTTVDRIGASAFEACAGLTGEMDLTAVTAIGDRAFYGSGASGFVFGPALATLGDLALLGPQLATISFTADNPNFDMENGILYNEGKTTMIICPAKNAVSNLVLPDGLTNILHYAAYGSSISGRLTLPESIMQTPTVSVAVADYAFADSTGITSLDIRFTGQSIISPTAFSGCTGLTSLRVSNTVKLGDLFSFENRIAEYRFFGGQSSGLENYYENNYTKMPWAHAAGDVRIAIVFESGSAVDPSMFRFENPSTAIVSADLGSVSSIGNNAFRNCAGLETLNIPDGVRTMDASALTGCSGLRSVTLPISLNAAFNANGNIGELALTDLHFTKGTGEGYTYLTNYRDTIWFAASTTYSVYLEEGIASIGDNMYLKPLGNVTFPSTLKSIGANAFCNSAMGAVTLNDGLETLGDNAFGSTPITRLTIPDTLKVTDPNVAPFRNCTQLASVSLPITISYANSMFDGCINLTSFTFTKGDNGAGYKYRQADAPLTVWYKICQDKDITVSFEPGIVSIGENTFRGCTGPLGSGISGNVDLSGITSVGAYAFSGCSSMSGVAFGNAMATIGEYAFSGCSSMSGVAFGNAMATIGAHAFENCVGISDITLGISVTQIGAGSFLNCYSVRSLTVPASLDTVRSDTDSAFAGCTGITSVRLTGIGEGFQYSESTGNNAFYKNTPWYISSANGAPMTLTIDNGVPSIGKNTFRDCSSIDGNVVLPVSVRTVGDYAFKGCMGMDGLEIRFSLTNVGKGAFSGCSSVRTLTLPISFNAVYYEDEPIFEETRSIESLNFTGTNGYVYSATGSNNYKKTPWYTNTLSMTVTFDAAVQSIGAYMFCECSNLQDTVDLKNISSVGEYAFQGCSGIRGVTADKLTNAGRNSFDGCSEMTQASMTTLKVVSPYMFRNTSSMGTLSLHTYCTTIGEHAFEDSGVQTINAAGESIVNLRSVTSVGDYAFAGSRVVSVILGTAGTNIGTFGDYVFYDCQYLDSVNIAGTVNTMPYNTFRSAEPMTYTPRLNTLTARKVTNFYANLSDFRELQTVDISGTISFIPVGSQQQASFKGCTALQKVTLYRDASTSYRYTLPASMFEGCSDLDTINLEYANINTQNGREFYGCSSLPAVSMLYSTSIADYSFYGCTSLTSISAPKASTVGLYAFAGSGLTAVNENDLGSVTTMSAHAFDSCISLVSVVMNKVEKINATDEASHGQTGAYTDVFYGCTSLTSVRMDSLLTITTAMFFGCDKLAEVVADRVRKIENLAFYGCSVLASVSFPAVTEIGVADADVTYENGTFTGIDAYSVFYNCSSLSAVSMPRLESVGALAFYRCSALAAFNDASDFVLGDTVGSIGTAAFANIGAVNVTVGETTNGVKRVSDYAFFDCQHMVRFVSASLTELPEHTFNNSDVTVRPVTSQLTTIDVPAVTKFFASLHGITSLTTVNMPSASEFNDAIFYGCTGLATVEMKATGTVNLSARMFYNCTSLTDIDLRAAKLPGNTQAARSGSVFYGCSSLRNVEMDICDTVSAGAFQNCTSLRTVTMPMAVTIGTEAFSGCVALGTVTAPLVTVVGDSAFYGCTSLSTLNPNADGVSGFIRITSIGSMAFQGCAFTRAVLGPMLREMGSYAFAGNRALNYVVLPNSLTSLSEGAFYGSPVATAYISSSITSIGQKAFDYGTTGVGEVSIFFNGELADISFALNAINGSNSVTLTAYGTHNGKEVFDALIRDEKIAAVSTYYYVERDFGIVRIDADDDSVLPYVSDIRVLYGSRFVLPFYTNGSSYTDYYFSTLNGGILSIYCSEADFAANRVARSGDDVPMFPLEDNGGIDIRGYTTLTPLEGKSTITIISNGNGEAVRPTSVVVHYGMLYNIPKFENEQTHISSLVLIGAGNLEIQIDETTESIYIGYAFNEVSMQSADTKVTVYFFRDGVRYPAEVLLRSQFKYPDELKDERGQNVLEIPVPGYEFIGWYSAENGGYKADETTTFKSGQTWYARFSPLSYVITVMDSGGVYATAYVTGPYVLYNTDGNLYYTDLNHTEQTLIIKNKDIEGYWIELYMDSGYKTIGTRTDVLVDDRSVVVKKNINYYTVNLQFLYNGTPVSDDVVFTMNGWGIGSERTYTNASDPIANVPFTIFKNGLVTPAPLSDNYTLSQLIVNGKVVSYTDKYIVDKSYLTSSLDVNFVFVLSEGQYAVEYRIGDDAGTVVNNGISYSEHDTITMIADDNYTRVGYTFVGFRIAGHEGTLLPMTQIALSREMINESQFCVVTAEGVWAEIDYTIKFDLAGYTGAQPPASIENVIIGDTIILPDTTSIFRIGQTITGWHFILGEDKASTVSHSDPFVLDKTMIEGYSDDNRVITMQCEWSAKSYTVRVDPNAGTKQFLPMNNIQYNDTIILWEIGSYTKSFMMFGGWSVGEDGTRFASGASAKVDDELAYYGDTHNGIITFYFFWVPYEYSVQYKLDGGEGDAPVDNNVYEVNNPETPLVLADSSGFEKAGYTFVGWRYSLESSVIYVNTSGLFESILAQSADANGIVTFYAVWSQKEYLIEYNLKGGVAGPYAPQSAMYGEDLVISAPTQPGFDFAGWRATTNATETGALTKGAQYFSSNSYKLWDGSRTVNVSTFRDLCSVDQGKVTFEAMWDNASYSVSYDKAGGSGTVVGGMTNIRVKQIIVLPQLTDAAKTGYTFRGWSVDRVNPIAPGTEFTTDMVEGGVNTVVFYAVWETNPYTVQYRYLPEQNYISMGTMYTSEFSIPTYDRPGYAFAGWDINGADSNAYWSPDGVSWYKLGSATVTGTYFKNLTSSRDTTVTINALWKPIQYRIAYSSNGGTGVAPVDSNLYTVGSEVVLKDYHVLDGTNGSKIVTGWSLDANGSVTSFRTFTEGLASRADATGTVNLYAAWAEGLCTVTVDLSGITVSEVPSGWTASGDGKYTTTVEYGTSMKDVMSGWEKVTLSKDGYTFSGWNYGSGTVVSNADVEPTFEKVDMKIAYVFGGVVAALVVGVIAVARFKF